MTDIEEIEQSLPESIPSNTPWWHFKRKIYETWRNDNYLCLVSQDQNVMIFEARREEKLGIAVLIGFSILILFYCISKQ